MTYNPISYLDMLIAAGWGDVRQEDIPANWRALEPPADPYAMIRRTRRPRRALGPRAESGCEWMRQRVGVSR